MVVAKMKVPSVSSPVVDRVGGEHRSPLWLRRALTAVGATSRFVATDAGKLHVLEAAGTGSLPPIVLLHGFSSSSLAYLPLMRHLRRVVRRVTAIDLPGHGWSDAPRRTPRVRVMREALLEALDRHLPEPAVVFGNSLGGGAAAAFAAACPAKVRALILCSPGGAFMDALELQDFLDGFRLHSAADGTAFVRKAFARPLSVFAHVVGIELYRRFRSVHFRELIDSLTTADLLTPAELSGIVAPTLLLWGQAERVLPPSQLAFFRAHLPAHTVVEQPRHFGHIPYVEYPAHVCERVVAFLQSRVSSTMSLVPRPA